MTSATRSARAQALIEFALILPILLFLVLGTFQVALMAMLREELGHAAREAAIGGCVTAEATVQQVLGRMPEQFSCSTAEVVIVELADPAAQVAPFFGDITVKVTGRAVVRETPAPSE